MNGPINEIVVSVVLVGEEAATPDHARRAIESLIAKAAQYPPDRRFDWRNVYVQAVWGK